MLYWKKRNREGETAMNYYFGVDYYPEHWPQDSW